MIQLSRKKSLIALACIILAGLLLLAPGFAVGQLKAALQSGGFQITSIGKTHVGLGGVTLENVMLDADGNSTIALVRAPLGLLAPSAIYIGGLNLSGEIGPGGVPAIDGWQFRPLAFPKSLYNIVLDSFRLDLDTSAGAITIEAKGQMIATGRKTRTINVVIFGNQQQLTLESKWDATWNANNSWTAAGEIGELRLRLGNFEMTRASGWLNLQSGKDEAGKDAFLPILGGQLNAGLVTLGPSILRNAGLTVNGPWGGLDVILSGQPGGKKAMQMNLEARQKNRQTAIDATVAAPGPDALFDFLLAVNTGLENQKTATGSPLAGLLLTKGNLDRIRKQLSSVKYTGLTMKLSGQPDALTGMIVTNGTQKRTVSFDPQAPAR